MRKLGVVASLGIIGVIMFLYYLFHAIQTPANSDYSAIILEAKSVYEGNLFLSGWVLSTVSYYTTEIPFYVIGIMIFGFTHRLLYIVPAVIYTLTIAAALWVVYDGKRIRGPLLTFAFIGIPVGLFGGLSLAGPIHIAAIFLCLVCVKLLQLTRHSNIYYVYFGLLFCWTLIGDTVALWILGAPIVLVGAYRIYRNPKQWKKEIVSPIIVCASAIVSKVVLKLIAISGGFVVPGTDRPMFARLEDIGRNVYSTTFGLLEMFHANFFGKSITSFQTLKLLLHFGGMILVIFIAGRFLYQMIKKAEVNYIDQLLVASIFVTIGSYLISNMNLGIETSRYLIPVVFFGAVLIGRWFNTFEWAPDKRWIYIACIAIYAASMLSPFSFSRTLNKFDHLHAYLESQGLKNGYGAYWLSAPITLYSKERVKVRQIIAPDGKMQPFNMLHHRDWYETPANFILFDSSNWGSINRTTAIQAFGDPVKELKFEDIHIMVWDKDISKYLSR